MAATSAAAYGYASNASIVASTLSSSTTYLYWDSKGWTILLFVCKYSWGLLLLCFNCLVQIILIICCDGIILARLSSVALVVLLGFELGSSLGFTLIFVWILTWGYGRYLFFPPNLGLTGSCLDYLFIGSVEISVRLVCCWFGIVLSTLGWPYCW